VNGAPLRVGEAGPGACRIPLVEELPPAAQIQLWILRMIAASRREMAPVGVLYRADAEAPAGVLFFRDLREEDFLLLHPEAIPYEGVAELVSRPVRPDAPAETIATPAASPASAPAPPEPPPAPEPTPEAAAQEVAPTPEPVGQVTEPAPEPSIAEATSIPAPAAVGTGAESEPPASPEASPPVGAPPAAETAPTAADEPSGHEPSPEEAVALAPEPAPPPPPTPAPTVIAVLGSAKEADLREPSSFPASPEPASQPEPDGWEKPVSSLLDGF
jgi:hypothetical protein